MVLRILQGAGNARDTLLLARHELVDGISADVQVRDGEVFATAGHRFTRPRFTFTHRGPRIADPARIPLDEVIRAADGRLLILDVHADGGDPAPDIARVLYPLVDRSKLVVACEEHELMERLRAWQPDLPVACSLATEGALRRYIQGRINATLPPLAVIVPDVLLHTSHEFDSLAVRSTSVGVRNVRTPDRARQLTAWGVHLVMSPTLEVLAAVSEAATTG